MYWECEWNVIGLEADYTGWREAEYSTRISLITWGCGQQMRRGPRQCSAKDIGMRLGNWAEGMEKELKISGRSGP